MSETRINQMTTVQKEALDLFRRKNTDYGDAFATYGTVGVIGRFNDGTNTKDFNGYIDDLRITKGIARYTGSFTPPSEPLNLT